MMRVAVWPDGSEWEVPGVLFEAAPTTPTALLSKASETNKARCAKRPMGKVERLKLKHAPAAAATTAVRQKKPKDETAETKQRRKVIHTPRQNTESKTIIRPLQLWLSQRPKGTSCEERHHAWREMSEGKKAAFAKATKAERGVERCGST